MSEPTPTEPTEFSALPLNGQVLKAVAAQGLEQPTPVQAKTIPAASTGHDLLISAETGSGKTAAFLLPILSRFVENPAPRSGTRALILLPTRELARQVFKQFTLFSEFTPIKAAQITGGDSFKFQAALLRKNPEIVISTPGRILEHVQKGSADFSDLEVLVLDEADRMLDMGFREEVLDIVKACKPERQTLLLSATLRHKGVMAIGELILNDPQQLTLATVRDKHANIQQQIMLADDVAHKERLVLWLLANESYEKALIFTNTRERAVQLESLVRRHGHRSGTLHGDMMQDERNAMMDRIRRGNNQVLVATDVAARGLDVKGIDLVINFDMARKGDDYVHRIGRTGRAGAKGLAISLIAANEWNLMASIERYLKQTFERRLVKELAGQYKGPKKLKASGKAAGSKKKKLAKKAAVKGKGSKKAKQPIAKKRSEATSKAKDKSQKASSISQDGFAPVRKKTAAKPSPWDTNKTK